MRNLITDICFLQMALGDLGVICLVAGAVILGYFLITYNWKRSQVKKVFKQVPFTDISKVKDGEYVKIKGVVWDGGEKIIAPLSERTCVYYHIEVLHEIGSGKSSRWETLFEEEVMADVVLKSGGYFAVIEADSPFAHLMVDKVYTSGFLNDPKPSVIKYLKKHGHDATNWIGLNKTMEYKEGVLQRGEEFAVTGRARWISSKELKFKVPVEKVLLISETKEDLVVLSEDPSLVKKELYRAK